jgi:ribonuclease E
MTKRMLIDSTHAEETRVVVLDGNRLEDYDVETSTKQQLKGNIYLAKVVRVEPSLQAAFVEYGGGRHGFLAFGEIHPDYYQLPVADRQRLLEMQEAEAREEEEAEDRAAAKEARARPPAVPSGTKEEMPRPGQVAQAAAVAQDIIVAPEDAEQLFPMEEGSDMAPEGAEPAASDTNQPILPGEDSSIEAAPDAAPAQEDPAPDLIEAPPADPSPAETMPSDSEPPDSLASDSMTLDDGAEVPFSNGHSSLPDAALPDLFPDTLPGLQEAEAPVAEALPSDMPADDAITLDDGASVPLPDTEADADAAYAGPSEPPPEQLGGETEGEYSREPRATPRFLRNYKIQEVIRRRQILLVQVVKEERGSKGAALTTYISLAGRFSVLMPNSPRGGGISRKITSTADRRRLKEVTAELDLPRGMGLIVRTAGASRPKAEILRDGEYLLNQWDQIRELTMKSMAPALIYEEASLIKRAIRDVYSRDVDDILVDGEQGWRAARDFMRMLMPTHAKKVQLWRDPQPLFAKAQVETQLDAMMLPTVQLRSGGYLVINQTEALVAIDVNSGRSTRERGIEETALRTNLEAAEETARQLRLRDLAGLIVIDFIDMESRRNNAAVEKRLKESLKDDRARIQLGSISHFGLLEMSRQRLRPSIAETSFVTCPHCVGTGTVRSTESAALHVLRGIEEEGGKRRAAEIVVHVAGSIALYILNNKRVRLGEIEERHGMKVAFAADDSLLPPEVRIDRVRAAATSELPVPIQQLAPPEPFEDPDEEPMEAAADEAEEADAEADMEAGAPRPGETAEEQDQRGKRRRRRRRGGRREDGGAADGGVAESGAPAAEALPVVAAEVPHEFDAVLAVGEAAMDGLPAEDGAATLAQQPGEAAGETAAEEADRAKRRGRRGGRRRRRDETDGGTENAPEPEASAPPPVPAYTGPTPADPFGGTTAYDIFDAIEQAEQERALAAFAPANAPSAATPVIDEMQASEPVVVLPEMVSIGEPETVEPTAPEPAALEPTGPEPTGPEPAAPESMSPELIAPELLALQPAMAEVDAPEAPVTETPASEPAAMASLAASPEAAPVPELAPAIVPVLVDGTEPAEKKRGWWRR